VLGMFLTFFFKALLLRRQVGGGIWNHCGLFLGMRYHLVPKMRLYTGRLKCWMIKRGNSKIQKMMDIGIRELSYFLEPVGVRWGTTDSAIW